jgi:glycosyltransferase involved in cell wall biosynthesis
MSAEPPPLGDLLAEKGVLRKLNEDRLVRRYRGRPQETLVSVVMPTWNRASIIRRAVDSVLGQSYRRLELLVADDGSEDETGTLLERHYRDDSRLRYLPGGHAGVSVARNRALEASRGELIAYLDTDDAWSEDFLLVSVNALRDRPGTESLYSGVRVIDRLQNEQRILFRPYERRALLTQNIVFLQAYVHTRDLFERHGGFREELRALEDWELVLRYTRESAPAALECCLVDYYIEAGRDRTSDREDFHAWYPIVRGMYREEISGTATGPDGLSR